MTAFIWFTCPVHYGMLERSVASVRQHGGDMLLYACISESDPDHGIQGVSTIRRTFDRGWHLDGKAATIGVAETLATIDADLVVKIDSDMILGIPFWRSGPVVFRRCNKSFVGLYALTGQFAASLPQWLATDPPNIHHEANAICRHAASSGVATVVALDGMRPDWLQFCDKTGPL